MTSTCANFIYHVIVIYYITRENCLEQANGTQRNVKRRLNYLYRTMDSISIVKQECFFG